MKTLLKYTLSLFLLASALTFTACSSDDSNPEADELAKAEAQWNKRLAACGAEEKPFLILQYANPVRNQYRIKAGLPL